VLEFKAVLVESKEDDLLWLLSGAKASRLTRATWASEKICWTRIRLMTAALSKNDPSTRPFAGCLMNRYLLDFVIAPFSKSSRDKQSPYKKAVAFKNNLEIDPNACPYISHERENTKETAYDEEVEARETLEVLELLGVGLTW